MNINYLWFFWIGMLFWFKLKVDVRIIWKNWKLKNLKKFKILKLNEDSGSKLFCIEISLLLIDMNVNGWNLNWLDV